jgi:hypothetical protein
MVLAREWDELVEQVRRLEGFHDFLRPPPLDTLLRAAERGPVVVVNVSRWRCDALVVTVDGVHVVELPDLTIEEVARRTTEYLSVLQDSRTFDGAVSFTAALEARAEDRKARERTLRSTVEWLWDVVAEPVLTFLDINAPSPPDAAPTRLWWCPTGLLTLLPLHGAGYHAASDGRSVLDRVVSSYTPTLRALSEAASREYGDSASEELLFVGVPDVPDQVGLTEDVAVEREFLRECFPGGLAVIEGADATVATVQTALGSHRWVHLSCHGYQNLNNPSAAGFELCDGILTVVDVSTARYAGEFAFLSACRTATGGLSLPDEMITLAAALNYTGYRHVMATLWTVDPAVAADMTRAVYPKLIEAGGFVPDRSARALHEAVRTLRDSGCSLDDWLPFTHTGP